MASIIAFPVLYEYTACMPSCEQHLWSQLNALISQLVTSAPMPVCRNIVVVAVYSRAMTQADM